MPELTSWSKDILTWVIGINLLVFAAIGFEGFAIRVGQMFRSAVGL